MANSHINLDTQERLKRDVPTDADRKSRLGGAVGVPDLTLEVLPAGDAPDAYDADNVREVVDDFSRNWIGGLN